MVVMIRHDLEFILNQILISEAHAAGADLTSLLPNPFLPWGLRTVDGSYNNLLAGQEQFGAADNLFPRALDPTFLNEADGDTMYLGPFAPLLTNTDYGLSGNVADADPRIISNLISDQTNSNPAATGASSSGLFDSLGNAVIPNVAPDEGLSAPFNSWMTMFGQFFDHGLDLVTKGGNGTVFIPLQADDPLIGGADGIIGDVFGTPVNEGADDLPAHLRFMALTRATPTLVDPDGDGPLAAVPQHTNTTTSWVDQNQTYTSHASHQVFLREYYKPDPLIAGFAVSTGHLLDGANGGLSNWTEVKAQALSMLGIKLSDHDIGNVPLLLTDQYGKFLPGVNGFAQVVVSVFETVGTVTIEHPAYVVEGTAAGLDINSLPLPVGFVLAEGATAVASVSRTGHAFLDDIAHSAAPTSRGVMLAADDDSVTGPIANPAFDPSLPEGPTNLKFLAQPAGTYDDELLGQHFITGDGRGNENIGLTSVHFIFHAEHNRLVEHTKDVILASSIADGNTSFLNNWLRTPVDSIPADLTTLEWNGERLFQAARFSTEMQYQHLVFEEFGRKVQPMINVFGAYDATIDPSIVAEFAHVVYRFGHSMLNETVDRYDPAFKVVGDASSIEPGNQQIGLIAAFLNPLEFVASGPTQAEAAGAIVRGMTRQVGNEIDEFVIEGLRNNLLGLPLDLATLNLARARETGVPTLNEARRQFFDGTGDTQLKPYESWVDFALHAKNELSVVNFIAAYGKHAELLKADVDTLQEKRDVAWALVTGTSAFITDLITGPDEVVSEVVREFIPDAQDRIDFLNSQGIYANLLGGVTVTGVDDIDFWIGGLAEAKMPFGGMLGSTFNFVFETQMEALQDGDRFYYLTRTAGLGLLNELEGNSFAAMIMRNTDAKHLPGDVFSTPSYILEVNKTLQFNEGLGNADPTNPPGILFSQLVSRDNPATPGPDTNFLRFNGADHVVLGGTDNADILIAGLGDDTIWGDGGNDRIEGGAGNDILNGGDGDDIITDSFGDDNIKGGNGNDVIQAGQGFDLILGGDGIDFVIGGEDPDETFGGNGNDFIAAGEDTSIVFGGAGDDWIEGGAGVDTLLGDNGDPFANGNVIGNDVLIGQGGDDDYDAEAGDDIMVLGAGVDRAEGMAGFDWAIYLNETAGIEADMTVQAFAGPPLPFSPNAFLDRFNLTEGLSGTAFSDILRGDDSDAVTLAGGNELTNFDLITGLKGGGPATAFFRDDVTTFSGGNIILGGDGSDLIEGRGGNDIIDGDAWLNVRLSIRDAIDPNTELFSVNSMSEIQARMLTGEINPSQIRIVREILRAPDVDFDTALFSGNFLGLVNPLYTIEGLTGDSISGYTVEDVDGDGFITVSHDEGGLGLGVDGVDLLRGIERFQFADMSITVAGGNAGPTGLLTISDTTPTEDQAGITVSVAGVTDADNVSSAGAITGPITYYWQAEDAAGSGVFVDLERTLLGEIVKVTGTTFTPGPGDAEVGLALRVRAVYQDEHGVIETVFSAPTSPVANVNDLPVGTVLINDMTPAEDSPLLATNAFTDPDGLNGVVFTYVWEASANNGATWTAVPVGNGAATFAPPQSTVGQILRVKATYTDENGTAEQVISASTAAVTNTQDAATGVIELSMTQPSLGAPITATPTDVVDEDGAPVGGFVFSYQWFWSEFSPEESWIAIAAGVGGTSATFTPGDDHLGGFLKVEVRFQDLLLHEEVLESSITGPVGLENDVPTGALVINDTTPTETFTLTAFDTVADANGIAPDARVYQWESSADGGVNWDPIVDATGLTFTPGQQQVGLMLRVVVTFQDDLGFNERVESLPTEVVGDQINGNAANNIINGTAGQDILNGAGGRDTLNGGAQNDIISGGADRDTLNGGDGNDTLTGGADRDIINGGAGADTINYVIGDGADTVNGGADNDTLNITGTAGANTLDVLFNGTSITLFDGSTVVNVENVFANLLGGNDTLTYDPAGGGLITTANVNVDLGAGTASGFSLIAGIENVVGGSGNDTLRGSAGANTLNGGAGNDTFRAFDSDGNDTYIGGVGSDTLDLSATAAGATVTTFSAQSGQIGNDSLNSIENIIGSSGNDTIILGGGVNVINGGGGADTINAGGGNDTITGGAGNDLMNGGAGNDTFIFASGFGVDTITGFDALAGGGQDRLRLDIAGLTFANLTISPTGGGANTLITIGIDETITLLGVNSANVDASDFLFGP